MAATLLVTISTGVAAVTSCFVAFDSGRQLLSSTSTVFVATVGGQYPSVRCGRGDKRTAKGKRFKGSFGNARPKDKSKSRGLGTTPLPPRPPKKDYLDGDFIQVDLDESFFSG